MLDLVKKIIKKIHMGIFGILGLVLFVLNMLHLGATNPNTSGPTVLFITFSLMYALILSIVLAYRMRGTTDYSISRNISTYVSSMAIAFAPLAALALSSLGQLRVADVLLIVLIELLLYFYIRYQFS